MDFSTLIAARYSVRKYDPRPVPGEVLEKVLEAGRLAPTAHNNQPQRVLVVRSDEGMQQLRQTTGCLFDAPMALVVCADRGASWKREGDGWDSAEVDGAIVATHMMLAAAEEGLGSCWVDWFDAALLRQLLALPEEFAPVCLMPLGYPAAGSRPSRLHASRKPLEETVFFEHF